MGPSFRLFIFPSVFKGRVVYWPESFGPVLTVFKREVTVFAVMGDLTGYIFRLL
jgi:hypothetical protein